MNLLPATFLQNFSLWRKSSVLAWGLCQPDLQRSVFSRGSRVVWLVCAHQSSCAVQPQVSCSVVWQTNPSPGNKASFWWINTEPGRLWWPRVKIVFWPHPDLKWATWMVKMMINVIGPYDNGSVIFVACNFSYFFKGSIQYLIFMRVEWSENCVINIHAHFVTILWPFVSSMFSSSTDLNLSRRMLLFVNYFFFFPQ